VTDERYALIAEPGGYPRRPWQVAGRSPFSLDGVVVFYTVNCSFGEEIDREPIEPLDQIDVAEYVATRYRASFSAQMVRVVKQSLKLRSGVSIFSKVANILTDPAITGTIEDNVNPGIVLAQIANVQSTRYRCNIGARGIVLTDCEFVTTGIKDESEIV
jgi:hypothetical protein